jgi:hypothetical protein
LQHPEIFPVYVACLYADAENFLLSQAKTFCLASFLALTKKDTCEMASLIFFLARKLAKQKVFALEW